MVDPTPNDECPLCGDLLMLDHDNVPPRDHPDANCLVSCACGARFLADGEGGYGDDGQQFRWHRLSDEPYQPQEAKP